MAKKLRKQPRKRGVKKPRLRPANAPTGSPGTEVLRAEYELWLADRLAENEKLAHDFHEDFLKSRKSDPLEAGIRARIRRRLEKYAKRIDRNRNAIRNLPDKFRAFVAEHEATFPAGVWAGEIRDIAACLDSMHEVVERQRSRVAAPMDEQEAREFFRSLEKLDRAMEKLGAFVRSLRARIEGSYGERAGQEVARLNAACDKLCEHISNFRREVGARRAASSVERVRVIQRATELYRKELEKCDSNIATLLESLKDEEASKSEASRDPKLESLISDFQSELGLHALRIDAVLYADALRFDLPWEADQNALKIRESVNSVIRDINFTGAKAGLSMGDQLALCDSLPEEELPEYSHLSPKPKEQEQYRAIVDALLLHFDACGPNATLSRKDLEKHVAALAAHRRVTGLGTTNVWNKLQPLVNKLKVVRQVRGMKTEANPNASDEFRLSLPAQSKYAGQAAAVRAEWAMIEALPASTDPAD